MSSTRCISASVPHSAFTWLVCLLVFNIGMGCSWAVADPHQPVRFDRDVRPILSDKCYHCHGPDEENRQADLRLDQKETALEWAIVPGDPEGSELIRRILSEDPDEVMPPPSANKELSDEERQVLVEWLRQGAEWTEHWAFVPPRQPPVPKVSSAWVQNPIDAFVWVAMQEQGLDPEPEADRATLIRRLSLDLTGLPPTPEEVDRFLADRDAGAYERLVDRLLASHHFGERMALIWLDAARYGDTSVYHADGPRDMWAWRDAVVRAYNQNMPFDRFTIAQLAGDLLPDATLDEQILAGFNRNNGTTDEGGAIPEEYRVEYAVDRVRTTSMVWLGLSLECGQCHDHKYDPISQEEYYRFFAFFNVSADAGMQTRNGNAPPILEVPDPERQQMLPQAKEKLAQLIAKKDAILEQARVGTPFQEWMEAMAKRGGPQLPRPILDAPLEESTGKETVDQVGELVGKLHGEPEWVKTPRGYGLKFNGKNFVDFGDVADFERDQGFSYGGWVKPEQGVGALVARMDDADGYRGFDLYVGPSGASVHLIHHWPDNAIKVTTKAGLEAGKWHHVFVTYDGSSSADGIKIYFNGAEQPWKIERNDLRDTIRTKKSLLIGSRHPGSRLVGEVDSVQIFDRVLEPEEVAAVAGQSEIASLLHVAATDRTPEQWQRLLEYYLSRHDETWRQVQAEIEATKTRITELSKPLTTVMIMRDMEKPRPTYVLRRGAYDQPTDRGVEPGVPEVLPPMAPDLPRNRLGLAHWLFQPDHPLTARVAVNRYWQMLFGRGLVSTPADFGSQGAFPTHPELLDWLAVDFQRSGWDIKRMIKQIVMSATYRQSSDAGAAKYAADPPNRWLARGSRFRLQGELIRDMALSVSGLLVTKVGGPGVKPYQPPGLWAEVGLGGRPVFKQDHGEKLYRRSLYTYWKRSAPPPSMLAFDAPTREKCVMQRPRTNTPLQALVTMNDPQFVEAGRELGLRAMRREGSEVERITWAFRTVTSRSPKPNEIDALRDILSEARNAFKNTPNAAEQFLSVGEHKLSGDATPEAAAWAVVGSTLLNLDETITRE